MATITWKNVGAPNFSGANQLQALASRQFDKAQEGLTGAFDSYTKRQTQKANDNVLRKLAGAQNQDELNAFRTQYSQGQFGQGADGALLMEALRKSDANQINKSKLAIEKNADARAAVTSKLTNTGLGLTNDQTQYTVDNQERVLDSVLAKRQASINASNSSSRLNNQRTSDLTAAATRAKASEEYRRNFAIGAEALLNNLSYTPESRRDAMANLAHTVAGSTGYTPTDDDRIFANTYGTVSRPPTSNEASIMAANAEMGKRAAAENDTLKGTGKKINVILDTLAEGDKYNNTDAVRGLISGIIANKGKYKVGDVERVLTGDQLMAIYDLARANESGYFLDDPEDVDEDDFEEATIEYFKNN